MARLDEYRREYGRQDQPFEIKAIASDAFAYDDFRRLVDAGVTDPVELRIQVFLRTYGPDLDEATREGAVAAMRTLASTES